MAYIVEYFHNRQNYQY